MGRITKGVKNLPPMDLFHGQTPKEQWPSYCGLRWVFCTLPNDYGADWLGIQGREMAQEEMKSNCPSNRLPRNGRGDAGMKEEWVKAIRESKPEIAISPTFNYAGNSNRGYFTG